MIGPEGYLHQRTASRDKFGRVCSRIVGSPKRVGWALGGLQSVRTTSAGLCRLHVCTTRCFPYKGISCTRTTCSKTVSRRLHSHVDGRHGHWLGYRCLWYPCHQPLRRPLMTANRGRPLVLKTPKKSMSCQRHSRPCHWLPTSGTRDVLA